MIQSSLIPNSFIESGIFCFERSYLFFGNGGSVFHGIFSPAVRFILMKDQDAHYHRFYLPRIAAQSAPPKPDRSEMPIFSIGRSGGGTALA